VPVQLLGVRKAALDGFLASGIDAFTFRGKTILVNPFLGVFPDVPHDDLDVVAAASALVSQWAMSALLRVGLVLAITNSVGRAVRQELIVWTQVTVTLCIVGELALIEVTRLVIGAAIANHAEEVSLL